jgi:hypothetical protein
LKLMPTPTFPPPLPWRYRVETSHSCSNINRHRMPRHEGRSPALCYMAGHSPGKAQCPSPMPHLRTTASAPSLPVCEYRVCVMVLAWGPFWFVTFVTEVSLYSPRRVPEKAPSGYFIVRLPALSQTFSPFLLPLLRQGENETRKYCYGVYIYYILLRGVVYIHDRSIRCLVLALRTNYALLGLHRGREQKDISFRNTGVFCQI